VGGVNQAVVRAYAAGQRYLWSGDTLKQAAQACKSSVAYTRAVIRLRMTRQTALLDAAVHGHVPLLTAAHQTDTVATLTVINN
jgi:hypothetical protein